MPDPTPPSRRPPVGRLVRPAPTESPVTTPLVPPIQLSSVYRIPSLDLVDPVFDRQAPGHFYARDGHPNGDDLAARLAALEGAEAALVGSSGMAVESAVCLHLLRQGATAALSDGLYGKTVRLVAGELARFGVACVHFDPTAPATLEAALTPDTTLAFVETLSNPLLRLADLPGLAAVCQAWGIPLIVDNTFAPWICRPLEWGATFVTHSLTKLIGGHGDLTQGVLAGPADALRAITALASTFGLTGNPFESWLCARGLATLPLRSDRACATALDLAARLQSHPAVAAVHYPGLPDHPDHDRARRLLSGGFGHVLTIDLATRDRVAAFFAHLEHIPFAPSLGDVSTTLSHPATTSHRGQTPAQWARQGITPGLVRFSIGLEDPAELWAECQAALQRL